MTDDSRNYRRDYMRARRAGEKAIRPPKNCLRCGSPFVPRANKRYCTEECCRATRLERRNAREYCPEPIDCKFCGQRVPYKSGKTKFCSDDCQLKNAAKDAKWRVKGLDPDGHGLAQRCALCGTRKKKLVIDHDHACCPRERACGDCVRGLLCHSCNLGLGMFKDDTNLMRKAIRYVEQARQLKLVI